MILCHLEWEEDEEKNLVLKLNTHVWVCLLLEDRIYEVNTQPVSSPLTCIILSFLCPVEAMIKHAVVVVVLLYCSLSHGDAGCVAVHLYGGEAPTGGGIATWYAPLVDDWPYSTNHWDSLAPRGLPPPVDGNIECHTRGNVSFCRSQVTTNLKPTDIA